MSTQANTSKLRRIVPVALIAMAALAAGYLVSDYLFNPRVDLSGLQATHFATPRAVASFELVDHTGNPFTNESLQGHWSLVFFGYTHCPDVCPTTLSVLNSVAGRLAENRQEARFVFISIDPERDTPERLAPYVSYFNGEFIGVTGEPEQIENLTRQLGVIYARALEDDQTSGYLMDHTASVLLFDPDGRFHALFSPPLQIDVIADDFTTLARAYR